MVDERYIPSDDGLIPKQVYLKIKYRRILINMGIEIEDFFEMFDKMKDILIDYEEYYKEHLTKSDTKFIQSFKDRIRKINNV